MHGSRRCVRKRRPSSPIVSERLGHANVSITLDVYSHAVPTLQREAASQSRTDLRTLVEVVEYHEPCLTPNMTPPRAPDLQEHWGDRMSEGRVATYAHDSS